MKIQSARFIKGITGTDPILYDGRFQVAFMGRSNVGKSTLINSLALRPSLARSSSSPGKTIRMDFFLINERFYFVDFPGYGYAKVSGKRLEKLRKMILWYLMYSEVKERVVVMIIDAKVGVTTFDTDTLEIMREHHIEHIVVANKIDNIKAGGQRDKQLESIRDACGNALVVPYSSKENFRKSELLGKITAFMPE